MPQHGDGFVSTGQAALWYAERCGWPVLPVWGVGEDRQCACGCPHDERCSHQPAHRPRDIGKHPIARDGCPGDPADASCARATILDWYRRRPAANVAVAVRRAGLVVADCDGRAAYEEAQACGVPAGALWATTGQPDHWHVYFRRPADCPTARAIHQGTSGAIDVLGDGYVLLPPSKHRAGRQYRWTPATTLRATAHLPEAPVWLLTILRDAAAKRSHRPVTLSDEPTTANGAVLWARVRGLLDARIIRAVEGGPAAYEPREGGDPTRSGCDAAVCHALVGAGLTDAEIRAVYQALPVGQHGKYAERGDRYLATTLANQRAYTEGAVLHLDDATTGNTATRSAPLDDGGRSQNSHYSHNAPPPRHSANRANSANESAAWPHPVSLGAGHGAAFPVAVLPGWLGTWVEATAVATQTPTALAAMMALAVVAAACARRVVVRVRPGWSEPLNLFTVTTLGPGNRKSAVVREAIAPLEVWEREAAQRLSSVVAEAETRRRVLEGRVQKLQHEAARTTDASEREPLEAEAINLAQELASTRVPVLPRLIVDDCTPERLASLLHEQDGRLAVLSPEGGVFDILAGRYSATGTPNFEVFLKGHAGDTLRVDRVGRPAEYVERPALTVGLAVQPVVLGGLLERAHFRGRGLLGRFLYAMPESLLGRRDTQAPPAPPEVTEAYQAGVRALLALEPAAPTADGAHTLRLSPGAAAAFEAFHAALEPRLGEEGDLALITDWAGKLVGTVARLAALLHLAAHAADRAPWEGAIDATTMTGAIALGEWLIEHAKLAFAIMGADPAIEEARHLLRWLRKERRETFTKRDAFEGTKGRFKRVEAMEAALQVLLDYGYAREQEPPDRTGRAGRRPSPVYAVNPAIYAHTSQNDGDAADCANTANCASAAASRDSDGGPLVAARAEAAPAESSDGVGVAWSGPAQELAAGVTGAPATALAPGLKAADDPAPPVAVAVGAVPTAVPVRAAAPAAPAAHDWEEV